MLFQNKKKIDSRIRFQNSRFKDRLSQARGYKRPVRGKAQSGGAIFLSKIGLGSWYSCFASSLIFLLLIYLVFIPNIFFVKHIIINGAPDEDRPAIEALTNSFFGQKLPWPQKNLLLLSKGKLKDFLLKNDQKILNVPNVSKKLPATLIINIAPRVDKFVIQTASSTYFSVSGDGLVTNEVFLDASGTLQSALISIKLQNNQDLTIGHNIFNQNQIALLNQLQSNLPNIVKSQIDYFSLENLQAPDLTVFSKMGLKLKFSFSSEPGQIISHLRQLFTQFSDGDIKNLAYVDMRFGDKGFTCNKGAPCVQDINLPSNSASTTQLNLSN